MTVTSSSTTYRTNTIYYPKSNYFTPTKTMEPAASTSSLYQTHTYCVFSPPELVHDDEEEDEEDPTPLPASPPTTPPACLIMNQHRISKNSISASPITKRRKCIPHRSPSPSPSNDWIFTWPSTTTSTTFIIPQHEQQYLNYSYQPRIVYLRQRLGSDPILPPLESPSSPLPLQTTMSAPVSTDLSSSPIATPQPSPPTQQRLPSASSIVPLHHHQQQLQDNSRYTDINTQNSHITSGFSSGRPIRLKGPCQACHESSEACMRKAFNWPFPSDEVYYDKGRPFVYLCNKCGLRYNKSGGSVCRQCRWVLCKEEKRKVIQLIDAMRSSRADGQISLDEDIASFVCTPKYWNCGQPWKIRWALNDLVNIDDKQ